MDMPELEDKDYLSDWEDHIMNSTGRLCSVQNDPLPQQLVIPTQLGHHLDK
jgi:hypothetical protein